MRINACFTFLTLLWIANLTPRAGATGGEPSEGYAYVIYFGSEDCSDEPASIRGYSSEQTFQLKGYSAQERKNETNMDLCTLETICLNHPTTDACTVNQPTVDTDGIISVSEEGLIYECDTSNKDAECAILNLECYESSIFPSCRFHIISLSTLVGDPSLIKHDNAGNERALDLTSYMVFYSDEECNDVEGLEMIANNENNRMGMTNQDVSCRDAMKCALHPETGETGSVCQELLGVEQPPTFDQKMMPISNGHAVPCDEDGNCEPISPDTCQKSTIHPNCYFRLPTSAALFGDPEDFLKNYVSPDTGEQGEPDGTSETGDGGASAKEEEVASSSSSFLSISSTFAMALWAMSAILV